MIPFLSTILHCFGSRKRQVVQLGLHFLILTIRPFMDFITIVTIFMRASPFAL